MADIDAVIRQIAEKIMKSEHAVEVMTVMSHPDEETVARMGDPRSLQLVFEEEVESVKRWVEKKIRDKEDFGPQFLFYRQGNRDFRVGLRPRDLGSGAKFKLALIETMLLGLAAGIDEVISFSCANMRLATDEELADGGRMHEPLDNGDAIEGLYVAAFGSRGQRLAVYPFEHVSTGIRWLSVQPATDTIKGKTAANLDEMYWPMIECLIDPIMPDETLTVTAMDMLTRLGHDITRYS